MYEWGWSVEPDPDYQVSVFTCDQMSYETTSGKIWAGLNDSFFCDEDYDKLYKEQATEMDPDKRAESVKQAQQMVYDSNAYVIPEYYDYLQAYRSDRYTDFTRQPTGDGAFLFQYGIYSYMNIEPVTDGGGSSSQQLEHRTDHRWSRCRCGAGRLIVWLATRGTPQL